MTIAALQLYQAHLPDPRRRPVLLLYVEMLERNTMIATIKQSSVFAAYWQQRVMQFRLIWLQETNLRKSARQEICVDLNLFTR